MLVWSKTQPAQAKFNICGPIGGFANHVRWLALLHCEIDFEFRVSNENYTACAGHDWPNYYDYLQGATSVEIQNMIQLPDMSSNQQRFEWIIQTVYKADRSWHNWLVYEWQHRRLMDQVIALYHNTNDIKNIELPTLVVTVDPELAYHCYLKFNSSLNTLTPQDFKQQVLEINEINTNWCTSKDLVLSSNVLYNSILDLNFYKKLVEFFGLNDDYELAAKLHSIWYHLHKSAEKSFVNDIAAIYLNGHSVESK